jgi:hypothetical protein
MKKVIFSLAVSTAILSSCKKDEIQPTKTCNCGLVVSDNASNFSVNIKNECSGNIKTWYLSESDWMKAYVGSNFCITNTKSW